MKYKKSRPYLAKRIIGAYPQFPILTKFITDWLLEKAEWPQYGDKYWLVDIDGGINSYCWNDHPADKSTKVFGNMFKTKKEAIKARNKIREVLND